MTSFRQTMLRCRRNPGYNGSSGDADLYHSLKLKSAEDSSAHAVLCTSNQTFDLRQVSTSNELYVIRPSKDSSDGSSGLVAIGQPQSTLEVMPSKPRLAVPLVQAAVPVYASTGHAGDGGRVISKTDLFANLPLSDAECEQAWIDLACFEHNGHAVVPNANVKVKVWNGILTTATANGIDLSGPLDQEQQAKLVASDDDWPSSLCEAVLRSMLASATGGDELHLDEIKSVRCIGASLLKDQTESRQNLSESAFLAAWADSLPEQWRGRAELKLLQGSYRKEAGHIAFSQTQSNLEVPGNGDATSITSSAAGAKRKWHEKFRSTKRGG